MYMKTLKKSLILSIAGVVLLASSLFTFSNPAFAAQTTKYTSSGTKYYYSQSGWWDFGGNVRSGYNGCGVTAFAIAVSILRGKKITPRAVAEVAYKKKYWGLTGNTPTSLTKKLAGYYGLKYGTVKKDAKKMAAALVNGRILVIRSHGSLPFTSGGHYVTVVGARADGYFKVVDPGHSKYRPKWIKASDFLKSMTSSTTVFTLSS